MSDLRWIHRRIFVVDRLIEARDLSSCIWSLARRLTNGIITAIASYLELWHRCSEVMVRWFIILSLDVDF
jgi:hypothetical protein